MAGYVDCVAKSAPLFHRHFIKDFFPELEKAVLASLLGSNPAQLRNTSKERFDETLESLYKVLLPRLGTRTPLSLNADKHMVCIELGLHFLDQNFLNKRIDGLKLVNDASAHCL